MSGASQDCLVPHFPRDLNVILVAAILIVDRPVSASYPDGPTDCSQNEMTTISDLKSSLYNQTGKRR